MQTIQYQVSGLNCGACVNRVKTILDEHAETVEVTLTPPIATLTNPTSDLNTLNNALSQIGDYQLSAHTDRAEAQAKKDKLESTTVLVILVSIVLLTLVATIFL
jgi:copper chaperone CopZ